MLALSFMIFNILLFLQVLLLGPAGCGKKSLVQQICNNTCTVLQKIDCSELCRPEPGETESLLKKKFEYALQLSKECKLEFLSLCLSFFLLSCLF